MNPTYFGLVVDAFILLSLVMVVYVPVAYASPNDTSTGIWIGSITWVLLLGAVTGISFFVT